MDGYVVIANLNSEQQAVIGGASKAVEEACEKLLKAGFNVVPLPVSHAFHTSIVAPASGRCAAPWSVCTCNLRGSQWWRM